MSTLKKTTAENVTTDALGSTSWPMIHCDQYGTKTSPYVGPVQENAPTILTRLESDVILTLTTPDVIYIQEAANNVKAFNPETMEQIAEVDLGATFPFLAGGTLDADGYLWFTANNKVARISPDLSDVTWSEELTPANLPYNTCFFLPDGNLLVTSCSMAHVLSSELENDTFKIISSFNMSELEWNGQQIFPWIPILPRPVSDEEGGLYFTSVGFVTKLQYDTGSQRILPDPVWVVPHEARDASFNLCDPVLVSTRVYAVAMPQELFPMQVYSIDSTTGEVEKTAVPFPDAPDAVSAHTIGAVKDKDIVIVICNTPDLTGGMVAMNAETLEVIWHAPIAVIGSAFCCSLLSNKAYIISRDPEDANLKYWAIDLDDGSMTVLCQYLSDTDPAQSLPTIGYDGRLLYPNPAPGIAMIQDK